MPFLLALATTLQLAKRWSFPTIYLFLKVKILQIYMYVSTIVLFCLKNKKGVPVPVARSDGPVLKESINLRN